MTRLRLRLPITVRVYGVPEGEQMEQLSQAVARGLRRAISRAPLQAQQAGWALLAAPDVVPGLADLTFRVRGAPIQGDSIERAIRQGIQRGLSRENLPEFSSTIMLAQYRTGSRPQVNIAPGQQQAFWTVLRQRLLASTGADPQLLEQRSRAIETLIVLVEKPEARNILRAGLDIPAIQSGVRADILIALVRVARDRDIVWDLILYGVGRQGDFLAEAKFADWFRQGGGRHTVEYLERKLTGPDYELQQKAARVVLHLLELRSSPEARHLSTNFQRLQALATRQNLWVAGPLGVESLWQLIKSQSDLLFDLLEELAQAIHRGPFEDPYREKDLAAIKEFQALLQAGSKSGSWLGDWFASLLAGSGGSITLLEKFDTRLSQAIQGAIEIRKRIDILYRNAKLLREFLGSPTIESDEITAMFNLRHDYIRVLTHAFTENDFVTSMREVDIAYTYFDKTVGNLKLRRINSKFWEVHFRLLRAKEIQPGAGRVEDNTFFKIREELEENEKSLAILFSVLSHGTSSTGLADIVRLESDIGLFNIQVSMFMFYAGALNLHNTLASHSVQLVGLQTELGKILLDIRAEIAGYYQHNQYKQFIDRVPQLKEALEQVEHKITTRLKIVGVVTQLLVLAASALIGAEVAALARLALAGEVVAGVRSAYAASALVLLAEAGAFTAAQLSGEALFFGKPGTLGSAAETFLINLVTFGIFRVLGVLTQAMKIESKLLSFATTQLINLGVMTGISALTTRLQTREWPHNIGEFLLNSLASYVVLAGISAAARKITAPQLEARISELADGMDFELARLYRRYRFAVETGTLEGSEFEDIRRGRLALNKRALELARFLRNEGLINKERFDDIEEFLKFDDAFIRGVGFTPAETIRALPEAASMSGLVRLGTTNVYRYDPGNPPADLPRLIGSYERGGYQVQRYPGGIVRVVNPRGETQFVLEAGPAVPALLPPPALPKPGVPLRDLTFVEFVTGPLTDEGLATLNGELNRINPRLVQTLEVEFPKETALAALDLIIEQRGKLRTRWPIEAVRGLATMKQLERGITRTAVRHLFIELDSSQLGDVLQKYQRIADMPGAKLLVDEDMSPSRSVRLINAYDAIRRARLQLPENMSRRAIRGLLRWVEDPSQPFLERLGRVRLDQRLAILEAASPIKDPQLRQPSRVEALLHSQTEDIRPGLNLLHGSLDEVVQAIEARTQQKGGRFTDASEREEFKQELQSYRELVERLQAGEDVERNVIGKRNEINVIIAALEGGAEVFALGNKIRMRVRLDIVELKNGAKIRLLNAPPDIPVQIDLGTKSVDGRLLVRETTTGEVTLPEILDDLADDASAGRTIDVDYNELSKDIANRRKFLQLMKLSEAAKFVTIVAKAIGSATGEQFTIEAPTLVLEASKVSPRAQKVAELLGAMVIKTEAGSSSQK
jgi:hypothetical protein